MDSKRLQNCNTSPRILFVRLLPSFDVKLSFEKLECSKSTCLKLVLLEITLN